MCDNALNIRERVGVQTAASSCLATASFGTNASHESEIRNQKIFNEKLANRNYNIKHRRIIKYTYVQSVAVFK